MPPIPKNPDILNSLYHRGIRRMREFCDVNGVPIPSVKSVERKKWRFAVCAYCRPTGIHICLSKCARPCGEAVSRQWSWPGSTTDRTPYGVIAHELGHYCDWYASETKGSYGGDYSVDLLYESREIPLTSYAPNPWEWFAEMFRLFVTNPDLLRQVRPKTYRLLTERWKPVGGDWRDELGPNVPARVIRALVNKGAE